MDISHIQSSISAPSTVTNTRSNTKEKNNFANVLHEQAPPSTVTKQDSITPLVQSALVNSVHITSDVISHKAPVEAMEAILQSMEDYMVNLADTHSPKTLPELHTELANVEKEMNNFNALYTIDKEDPLYSMLTSLEILILRERYRFNRGSYTL